MMPLVWIVIGGLLEPVWVIGLKKYDDTRSLLWGAFAAIFMFVSPAFLALGMKDIAVGVSYAIWTGIGMIATLILGVILYKENPGRIRTFLAILILVGVVGMELSHEVVL
jgi:multidrug transporter EmrE-like cation transporter